MAISEADVIILVVDAAAGLTPLTGRRPSLRRTDKPVLVAANKIDGLSMENAAAEFHALVSASHSPSARNGYGFDEFLKPCSPPFRDRPSGRRNAFPKSRVSSSAVPTSGSRFLNASRQDRFTSLARDDA
jgi:predicted GTPase